MSISLQQYSELTSSSSRKQVSNVLQSIIDTFPVSAESTRAQLIQALLDDLQLCTTQGGPKGRLTPSDAAQALLVIKTLGKNPTGSQVVATSANLSKLLGFTTLFEDDIEASSEALRCVANALLLIAEARTTWTEKEVGGGQACVGLLDKATSPDRIFIVSRILFLCTASPSSGDFIRNLVEQKRSGRTIVDIIGSQLDFLTAKILASVHMAQEAMVDLLKLVFNLLVHYPKMVGGEPQNMNGSISGENKVIGDFWSPNLDGILLPLLRVFTLLPSTHPSPMAPPLTHVIHSLITIPVSPSLRSIWLGKVFMAPPLTSERSAKSSRTNSPILTPKSRRSDPSSRSNSPIPKDLKSGAIDRALSVLAAGRRPSRSPSPLPSALTPDTLLRAYDLLDISMSHYAPGDVDPDEPSIREMCRKEGEGTLDDLLSPLVMLVTRLCIADTGCRSRTRGWLLPPDLDRTRALEARTDLLGRCLRLLGSVYHPRLKDAVGEMLFAICDCDASMLASQVGYGNVAGFLFHKGVMSAPVPSANSTTSTTNNELINPITGTIQEKLESPAMTDEEKEAEAEKLFVLFDRLEKSGAIPPSQNPIRKAAEQGKLQL